MGTSENSDDQPYGHYTAKHNIVAWVSRHLFDGIVYTSRRGLLEGMKRKGGLGWLPAALSRGIQTAEYRFWKSLNLKDLVVYDVGAFEGLLALFFARQAKAVICYEPNTRNYTRLMENLRLNSLQNVTVRRMGVGSSARDATMIFSQLMPGGASIESAIADRIRIAGRDTATETIRITTLDQDIQEASLPAPDFVKIDIEGFEIEALRGARKTLTAHSPELFLEMHGETMNQKRGKVQEIIEFLKDTGYQTIRHIETGTEVHRTNAHAAAEGHLYCPGRSMARTGPEALK